MHPELLVRKRIWLMTLVLTGLFLLAAARIAVLTTSEAASLTEPGHSSVDESRHCYGAARHDYRPKGANARHLRDGVHRHC